MLSTIFENERQSKTSELMFRWLESFYPYLCRFVAYQPLYALWTIGDSLRPTRRTPMNVISGPAFQATVPGFRVSACYQEKGMTRQEVQV